jgi:hypothetical protein
MSSKVGHETDSAVQYINKLSHRRFFPQKKLKLDKQQALQHARKQNEKSRLYVIE